MYSMYVAVVPKRSDAGLQQSSHGWQVVAELLAVLCLVWCSITFCSGLSCSTLHAWMSTRSTEVVLRHILEDHLYLLQPTASISLISFCYQCPTLAFSLWHIILASSLEPVFLFVVHIACFFSLFLPRFVFLISILTFISQFNQAWQHDLWGPG